MTKEQERSKEKKALGNFYTLSYFKDNSYTYVELF